MGDEGKLHTCPHSTNGHEDKEKDGNEERDKDGDEKNDEYSEGKGNIIAKRLCGPSGRKSTSAFNKTYAYRCYDHGKREQRKQKEKKICPIIRQIPVSHHSTFYNSQLFFTFAM